MLNKNTLHASHSVAIYALLFALCVVCLIMASALNSDIYPLRAKLLYDTVLPVHHVRGSDLGASFYFEQRYWLSFFVSRLELSTESER